MTLPRCTRDVTSRRYRVISRRVIRPILNHRNRATAKSGNRSGRDAEISESRLELRDVLRDVNATFSWRFARRCVWFRFFATFYAMSRKKTSRKPTLFFFIQRRWFLPVLLGCYDILMDVIICDTLWYLIRPIGRLLKIAFCEMWGIILCSQCRVHVKDYVSKTIVDYYGCCVIKIQQLNCLDIYSN